MDSGFFLRCVPQQRRTSCTCLAPWCNNRIMDDVRNFNYIRCAPRVHGQSKQHILNMNIYKYKCACLWSDIPSSSADFTIYTTDIGTLSYMVSSLMGEYRSFSTANAIQNFAFFFISPGTHHYWVDKSGMI